MARDYFEWLEDEAYQERSQAYLEDTRWPRQDTTNQGEAKREAEVRNTDEQGLPSQAGAGSDDAKEPGA